MITTEIPLRTVVEGSLHAHTRGILRRGIKQPNVMTGKSGEVYVVDWGIAVSQFLERPEWLPWANVTGTLYPGTNRSVLL